MKISPHRSEERFLADQAADARTAMMQTLQEMKQTLAKAADVRTGARQHPWIATSAAVAIGFVAGVVLPRSQSTSGVRRPANTDAAAPPESTARDSAHTKTGFLVSALGKALTEIMQTLIQGFFTAAVVAREVDPLKEKQRHGSPPRPDLEPQMDTDANGSP